MAQGYYMTSKVKIPKSTSGNYIAGIRFNRHEHDFELVLKDSSNILQKMDIGQAAAFAGYISRNFFEGGMDSSKKVVLRAVKFLIRNKSDDVTKSIQDFQNE